MTYVTGQPIVFVGCGQSGTSGGEDTTNVFYFAAGGGPPMEMDITQAGGLSSSLRYHTIIDIASSVLHDRVLSIDHR